jgi:hypothetical protein
MAKSTLPNLTHEEWQSVKDLSATLTGYEEKASHIRGKKTLEILQDIEANMKEGDYVAAHVTLNELIRREAFKTMCGVEGKSRRKAKARSGS